MSDEAVVLFVVGLVIFLALVAVVVAISTVGVFAQRRRNTKK